MQVKMTDMQVRGTPRDMLPGDPHCAPLPAVLAEAYISLLRKLSITDTWSRQVKDYVPSCISDSVVLLLQLMHRYTKTYAGRCLLYRMYLTNLI
jgi:hypothetical protein